MQKYKQEKSFSPRFWPSPKQKKLSSSTNFTDSVWDNSASTPKISNTNISQQIINDSSSKISSHVEHFFNDHLKFDDVKIELDSHQLVISFKPNEKCFDYIDKITKYSFLLIRMQPKKIYIDVEFKDLHKFFGIMGEQYKFKDTQDFLNFLQPHRLSLYNMGLFYNKENVSAQLVSDRVIDSQNYISEETNDESTVSYRNSR